MTQKKKTHPFLLLALLAAIWCACMGSARAQADYLLYGVADLSAGRFEPSGTVPDNRFNSNSLSASFAGLNLKYGLDGGWTPGLTLETFVRFQDFKIGRRDTDPILSRNAFVSLNSDYGLLRVGRVQSFLFDSTLRFNALGNSIAFSPAIRHVFLAGNLEGVQGDFYWDRAVSYNTPNLEGVTFSVMRALPDKDLSGHLTGGSLVVARGLLGVVLAAQQVKLSDGFSDPTNETTVQLGATYNFGIVRVFGQFTATRDQGLDVRSKIATAGANLAFGPGNLLFQAATTKATGPAVNRKHTSLAGGYVWPYDSVTDFYLLAMDDRVNEQTRGVSAALGVRYKF
jgi:predicted porin